MSGYRSGSQSAGNDDGTLVYRYGGKLYQRTYQGSPTHTFATSGDGKRHSQAEVGATKYYYWDAGYTVVNESDGTNLTRTYVGRTLAHVDGANPSTGDWAFYFHDHLGSTRRMRNAAGASIAQYEFEPYGGTYATTGAPSTTTHQWAGLEKDAGPYHYAPFRYYNNVMMRWTMRDPLGMIDGPNIYGYVRGNPTGYTDPIGGSGFPYDTWPGWKYMPPNPFKCAEKAARSLVSDEAMQRKRLPTMSLNLDLPGQA